MPKTTKTTINKSASTGRFVTNAQVKKSPSTTYRQTVTKKK